MYNMSEFKEMGGGRIREMDKIGAGAILQEILDP